MKKNIWIFNHYATDMFSNQGGRHYWFAKNLLSQKYSPTLFCANTSHKLDTWFDTGREKFKVDQVNGVPFVFVKTSQYKGNGLSRMKNMGYFYWNIKKVAKKYAKKEGVPDVILASSVHPLTLVAGIQIAKKFNIPCICEVRDLWPEAIFAFNKAKEKSLLGKILTCGEHRIYKKANALIFTKEGDTDYIKEKRWDRASGGDIDLNKAYYINNGVDLEAFYSSVKDNVIDDFDLTSNIFNVVYVGALRPINNVGNILDAAGLLQNEADVQFLIYGDGNQKEMLLERLKMEGLNNVKIKGFVGKQYIPYILSKSSVNLLNYSPTQYNWTRGNSSNKLFEYMASGKPIISTVKMGYSLIEKYQCGLELENGTPQELADAIMRIKEMPTDEYEKLGSSARKGAEDFDFKILTDKLIAVIESV